MLFEGLSGGRANFYTANLLTGRTSTAMKKRYPFGESSLASTRQVDALATVVRWFIRSLAGLLVIFFTWLQIRDVEVASFIEAAAPDILMRIVLIVYYFCWVFGSTFDLNLFQSVIVKDPNRGRLPWPGVGLLAAFGVVTATLLWASDEERRFAFALGAFWIVGVGGFAYLQYAIEPMFAHSAVVARHRSNYEYERFLTVRRYALGRWQWYRNAVSFCLICMIIGVTLSDRVRNIAMAIVGSALPQVSQSSLDRLLPALSFLVFVTITEGWIWYKRFGTRVTLEALDDLAGRYDLEPRKSFEL